MMLTVLRCGIDSIIQRHYGGKLCFNEIILSSSIRRNILYMKLNQMNEFAVYAYL